MRIQHGALLACIVAASGCASQPEVIASKPLWPFEQVEIRTSFGSLVGYASRPEGNVDRIVVALQSSPCAGSPRHVRCGAGDDVPSDEQTGNERARQIVVRPSPREDADDREDDHER